MGKRTAENSTSGQPARLNPVDPNSAIVPLGNTTVIVSQFENSIEGSSGDGGIPQKNANKKKLKGTDGTAVEVNSTIGSAASMGEDRREQ